MVQYSRDQMDAMLSQLTRKEAPAFLRAIELFERCGTLSSADAEEWRKRVEGWIGYLFGDAPTDGPGRLS